MTQDVIYIFSFLHLLEDSVLQIYRLLTMMYYCLPFKKLNFSYFNNDQVRLYISFYCIQRGN